MRLHSSPEDWDVEPFPVGAKVGPQAFRPPSITFVKSAQWRTKKWSHGREWNQWIPTRRWGPTPFIRPPGTTPFLSNPAEVDRVRGEVTLLANHKLFKGTLDLNRDNDWIFMVRSQGGSIWRASFCTWTHSVSICFQNCLSFPNYLSCFWQRGPCIHW